MVLRPRAARPVWPRTFLSFLGRKGSSEEDLSRRSPSLGIDGANTSEKALRRGLAQFLCAFAIWWNRHTTTRLAIGHIRLSSTCASEGLRLSSAFFPRRRRRFPSMSFMRSLGSLSPCFLSRGVPTMGRCQPRFARHVGSCMDAYTGKDMLAYKDPFGRSRLFRFAPISFQRSETRRLWGRQRRTRIFVGREGSTSRRASLRRVARSGVCWRGAAFALVAWRPGPVLLGRQVRGARRR